ncbi:hypothetical protein Mapa_002617 [Marchantia paleacea]|nr:hypothetical protein Mapa_002617 [Marchantia paleacea]
MNELVALCGPAAAGTQQQLLLMMLQRWTSSVLDPWMSVVLEKHDDETNCARFSRTSSFVDPEPGRFSFKPPQTKLKFFQGQCHISP